MSVNMAVRAAKMWAGRWVDVTSDRDGLVDHVQGLEALFADYIRHVVACHGDDLLTEDWFSEAQLTDDERTVLLRLSRGDA